MLCENLNVCSESTMTNSYYGQRTNLVDAAALGASSADQSSQRCRARRVWFKKYCKAYVPENIWENYSRYNVRSVYTFGLVYAARLQFAVVKQATSLEAHERVRLMTSKVVHPQVA